MVRKKDFFRLFRKTGEYFFFNDSDKLEPIKSNGSFQLLWVFSEAAAARPQNIGWPIVLSSGRPEFARLGNFSGSSVIGFCRSVLSSTPSSAGMMLCWLQLAGTIPMSMLPITITGTSPVMVASNFNGASYEFGIYDASLALSIKIGTYHPGYPENGIMLNQPVMVQ